MKIKKKKLLREKKTYTEKQIGIKSLAKTVPFVFPKTESFETVKNERLRIIT